MALEHCQPQNVFHFFEEICRIPHGSGNEKAISDHLVSFAKERNLWVHQDETFNVIIKKPGTPGYEKAPGVIIQGHMDMVCVKESVNDPFDFLKDPLQVYAEGDFVKAKGTSLGADNGVAVAMAMALLDAKDIAHPPLEIVLTTDEEVGMNGAAELDARLLDGRIFINLDSEEEGIFCASCAGGVRAIYRLPLSCLPAPAGCLAYMVKMSGLAGGHSGMMIHEERANANILLGRLLYNLTEKFDIYLTHINGGSADNAIAAAAECTVSIREEEAEAVLSYIKEMEKTFQNEFRFNDTGLEISTQAAQMPQAVFTKELTTDLIASLRLIPNGVMHMSVSKKGLVETSNNIGIIRVTEDAIEMVAALRSSARSRKFAMLEQIRIVAQLTGAELVTIGDYPEWEYEPKSKIRKLFMDTYNEMYPDREPAIEEAIHAGLECGWFAKKLKTSELVSLGPDHFDVHSVSERVSISSTERVWKLLKAVLAKLV